MDATTRGSWNYKLQIQKKNIHDIRYTHRYNKKPDPAAMKPEAFDMLSETGGDLRREGNVWCRRQPKMHAAQDLAL